MDKKYKSIRESIKKQAPAFLEFLRLFVLDDISYKLLMEISSKTDVYVFSGVIRNYLLGEPFSRDIDIVVRDLSSLFLSRESINDYTINKNSFGGYKASIGDLIIDIWDIEQTWSLLQNPSLKPTPFTLIGTAFFNFSAIVFDVRKKKFVFGSDFIKFYETKEIDVVNAVNPNNALCVVSTMYYAIKLGSPIRYKLCKWIVEHYNQEYSYDQVQLSHFHRILYKKEDIENFKSACIEAIPILKKYPNYYSLRISDNYMPFH